MNIYAFLFGSNWSRQIKVGDQSQVETELQLSTPEGYYFVQNEAISAN